VFKKSQEDKARQFDKKRKTF